MYGEDIKKIKYHAKSMGSNLNWISLWCFIIMVATCSTCQHSRDIEQHLQNIEHILETKKP